MNVGIALIVVGITIKSSIRMYRHIRKRQYLDPLRMYPGGFYSTMNRRQAQLILGVSQGTDTNTIKNRHRTLMLNNHPDNGGSTFIASKINQAKQLLTNG